MLNKLIETYAEELVAEAKRYKTGWLLHPQDTPQDKAVRVAVKTHELIVGGYVSMLQLNSPPWQRACERLKIEPTVEGVTGYLQ
jgi:hypothetical protein